MDIIINLEYWMVVTQEGEKSPLFLCLKRFRILIMTK